MMTIIDKVSRELDIIDTIFKCQFSKYNPGNNYPYPCILDKSGRDGINGRYISNMDIYSKVDILGLQDFKNHITERFENSARLDLLTTQLIKIKNKAISALDFYNDNLAVNCQVVTEYLKTYNELKTEMINNGELKCDINDKWFLFIEEHHAVVTILEYPTISSVYLGTDREGLVRKWLTGYKFNYFATNEFFVKVCKIIIDFIDEVTSLDPIISDKGPAYSKKEYDTLYEAFINPEKYQWIMNLLVTKKYCNSGNYSWIDAKENLSDLLKELHVKSYLHRKLSQNEVILISKNTFSTKISKSTMRNKAGKSLFSFIPLATTL